MDGSKRYIVLLSLISVLEILFVLIFPQYFIPVLIISVIFAITFFIFFQKRKACFSAVIFAFIILYSCINPYRLYIGEEKSLNSLMDGFDGKELECSAVIKDCRNYGSYSVIYARVYKIDGDILEKPFDARIGSYTGGALGGGDRIVFSGNIQKLSQITEDGFDTSTYLRSKRVFAGFPTAVIISSSAADSKPLLTRLRDFSKEMIYKYVPDGKDFDSASIAYAMFAGDKDCIPSELKEHFTRSGITHILCVSGMHLTIIMGIFYALFSFFTLHKKARCIAVIVLCIFYTAFTGFTLSTIRAAIMCIISFIAMMTGQKSDAYASLFFALTVICLFSPYALFDISLILSFSATLGILVFSELIPSSKDCGKIKKALIGAWSPLSANLGAVFFTLPPACFFFGSVSVFSVIATLCTSFLCEILLCALIILMLLSPVKYIAFLEPMLKAIGFIIGKTASCIIGVAKFFSSFKYAYTETDRTQSTVLIVIFAVIIILLTVFIALRMRRARFFCTAAIILIGLSAMFLAVSKTISDDGIYKVSYFRQNEDDRQLSVKLENHGYLIVNADSTLCMDKKKADFDIYNQNNYLLIIPAEKTKTQILADNIGIFDKRYGLKKIFVPQTASGTNLAIDLKEAGIECHYMPTHCIFGNTEIEYSHDGAEKIIIDDGKTSTAVVFADGYDTRFFDGKYDICAFFTRKTANQFDCDTSKIPDCDIFYTRMGRGKEEDGIINTFGKKSFYIKE